jgi:hypothetical protein
MEQKKITKAQLKKRIENAQLIVDRGKDYKAIYFSDIGVGIYICKDFVVTTTNFHQHVFNKITAGGYDTPSIFFSHLVDIANAHLPEIEFKQPQNKKKDKYDISYSIKKLIELETLSDTDKFIVKTCERFIYIINGPVYALGTDDFSNANHMLQWGEFVTRGLVFLDQKEATEDLSFNDLYNQYISMFRSLSLNVQIDDTKRDELGDKIKEIENKAYKEINATVENMGGKLLNIVALPKKTDTEAEALDQLQK